MAAPLSSNSATRWLPPELDMQMLCDAQAYLRCLHAHETPSAAQIQAFHCFYATYDPILRKFMRPLGLPVDDVDDACQEVWQDLHLKLPSFQSDGAQVRLCAWLRLIARSKAKKLLRYRLRHPCRHLDLHQLARLPNADRHSILLSRGVGPGRTGARSACATEPGFGKELPGFLDAGHRAAFDKRSRARASHFGKSSPVHPLPGHETIPESLGPLCEN